MAIPAKTGIEKYFALQNNRCKNMQIAVSGFVLLILAFTASLSYAEDLAACGELEGYAYYPHHGIVSKKDSGWTEDKVSNGLVSLKKSENEFDILYVGASKNPSSSRGDGGSVTLINHSKTDAVFIVHYPNGGPVEVYNFFEDSAGNKKYAVGTFKTLKAPVAKSSLMVGDCTFIDFESIK